VINLGYQTTDMFKGFSYILTRYEVVVGRKLNDFFKVDGSAFFFAIIIPLINGIVVCLPNHLITDDIGNRFIFASSLRGASYIAVPAAMQLQFQERNPDFPLAL
jgi:hypothetical protein